MTPPRSRPRAAQLSFLFGTVALSLLAFARTAVAEKIIAKGDDWEMYTDGRAAGFASYVYGDALPQATFGVDPNGNPVQLHDIKGGGFDVQASRQLIDPTTGQLDQGTVNSMRLRSGFIANTLGFGIRSKVGASTTATAYIQIWAFVESESRQKNRPNLADVRQGYAKLEGPWGALLAGRTRGLFSRGATDIDAMYGHRYGVGFPGSSPIDSNGPTQGQIGFGVLGSGFAAGVIYTTPNLAGLQLNVGAFDPIELQNGGWTRTKWPRVESELTFERTFGRSGKIVLFGNGAYQKVYQNNACPTAVPPDTVAPPCDVTSAGFGYGGRFELGPLRLGVAGHYGRGLGLNYALEVSDANVDSNNNLRLFKGYYAQTMLVLGRVDVSAGAGITQVFLNDSDNATVPDPRVAMPTAAQVIFPHSVIKYQMGINAGIVCHLSKAVHLDLDVFRAEDAWFLGEKQVVYVANSGMTIAW